MNKTYLKPEAETMVLSTEGAQMAAASPKISVSVDTTLDSDTSVGAKSLWDDDEEGAD